MAHDLRFVVQTDGSGGECTLAQYAVRTSLYMRVICAALVRGSSFLAEVSGNGSVYADGWMEATVGKLVARANDGATNYGTARALGDRCKSVQS